MQENNTNNELWEKCQALLDANPYAVYNGVTVEHVEADSVGIYTELRPEFTNIYGMAHGGLITTLLDNCAGLTVRLDGNRYVTLDMDVHFFANVTEGRLHARSQMIRRGRTVNVMDVNVTSDEGKLLAKATVTFFRIT
ncbi:MAG: PaaI family thioesterase [Lachnospiraceae bacterium]|nr:PaaI family thioesterase [Lachnospiraceae bacterium]